MPKHLYPGELAYGVLIAELYLESKGYEFSHYGIECVIAQAIGLPY